MPIKAFWLGLLLAAAPVQAGCPSYSPGTPSYCAYEDCGGCIPSTSSECSGDHYPSECCQAWARYADCLNSLCLNCNHMSTCYLALGIADAASEKCLGIKCADVEEFDYDGCDNGLLCACVDTMWTDRFQYRFNDAANRCPIYHTYLDCVEEEVARCNHPDLNERNQANKEFIEDFCENHPSTPASPPATTTTTTPASVSASDTSGSCGMDQWKAFCETSHGAGAKPACIAVY